MTPLLILKDVPKRYRNNFNIDNFSIRLFEYLLIDVLNDYIDEDWLAVEKKNFKKNYTENKLIKILDFCDWLHQEIDKVDKVDIRMPEKYNCNVFYGPKPYLYMRGYNEALKDVERLNK